MEEEGMLQRERPNKDSIQRTDAVLETRVVEPVREKPLRTKEPYVFYTSERGRNFVFDGSGSIVILGGEGYAL